MVVVGSGKFTYKVVETWAKLPNGWKFTQVAGIVIDSLDRVYVFNRSEHPMMIFDHNGNFINSWGEGMFVTPHGICLDQDKYIFLADSGNHTVKKFTLNGKLLMTLGTENKPGESGRPFNRPTDVSVSPSGYIYISDGYGNRHVHKFDSNGNLIKSWGGSGDGPGQFALPHGIFAHKNGNIYVADRENHRIQIFTSEGEFVNQWKTDFNMPCTVFIDKDDNVYIPELRHRISIMNLNGELIARWGGVENNKPGEFVAPHTACVDSYGNLYVGEVLEGQRIQKFIRN
ncbi:MAG: peptidyl-alpha-hydroxyglycine alpha-amidating lyase family protein [bacterium]